MRTQIFNLQRFVRGRSSANKKRLNLLLTLSEKYLLHHNFVVDDCPNEYEGYHVEFDVDVVAVKNGRLVFTIFLWGGTATLKGVNYCLSNQFQAPGVKKRIIAVLGKYLGLTSRNTEILYRDRYK